MVTVGVLTKKDFVPYLSSLFNSKHFKDMKFIFIDNHKESIKYSPHIRALFSLQYDKIIDRETIMLLKKQGMSIVNLHFAPLPKYRGMYPISHAILNGEKKFGITYHLVDEGIDTGSILAQFFFRVNETDTAEDLYNSCLVAFEKSFPKMIMLLKKGELFNNIKNQDNSKATYYNKDSIDFKRDSIINIYDITLNIWKRYKAFYFPKYQLPKLLINENLVELVRIRPVFSHSHKIPGRIVKKGKYGVIVETMDSYIEVMSIMYKKREIADKKKVFEILKLSSVVSD